MSTSMLPETNLPEILRFGVIGKPVALKRHRSTAHGHRYDPSAKDKQVFMSKAREFAPTTPLQGGLRVDLQFIMPRAKSHFRTGRFSGLLKASAPVHHTKTPDLDNLIKFVLDAMNGVFYGDDAQIAEIRAVKQYSKTLEGHVYIRFFKL